VNESIWNSGTQESKDVGLPQFQIQIRAVADFEFHFPPSVQRPLKFVGGGVIGAT
jgi:hypothetical protein